MRETLVVVEEHQDVFQPLTEDVEAALLGLDSNNRLLPISLVPYLPDYVIRRPEPTAVTELHLDY